MTHSAQAYYDAEIGVRFSRRFCTPGTRLNILAEIEKWATEPDSKLGYWMSGMAGTGKSTIAMSACKILKDKHVLAGTFFCSRQIPECRDYQLVIPTLAYQLARFSRTFASSLVDILSGDPDLATKSPDVQVQELLVKPWRVVNKTGNMGFYAPVIVLDALDECENISLVLKHLVSAIQQRLLPGLKFFLTSRPTQEVQLTLHSKPSDTPIQIVHEFILHNVEESEIQGDIYTYVKDELKDIYSSEEQLTRLKVLAGKLFIYASTVIKFVNAGGSAANKKRRLNSSLADGKNSQDLDQLYARIIETAIPADRLSQESKRDWKIIYSIMSLGRPLTCDGITELLSMEADHLGLGIESDDVVYLLNNLQAVFYISDQNNCIFTFHASFFEFMARVEGADGTIYQPMSYHLDLALACIGIMEQLRFNICGLTSSFIANSEVNDLDKRIEENIKEPLQYACQFWSYHVIHCEVNEIIIQKLPVLLMHKGIYWIEVMSLLGLLTECATAGRSVIEVSLKRKSSDQDNDTVL